MRCLPQALVIGVANLSVDAIQAAGELDLSRWESYQKLKEEAIDRDELLRRKREWSKGVAKFTKQRKKEIW